MAPSTMLAVIAPSYTDPSGYQLTTLPQPTVTQPDDVIIRVYAASINPVDVKLASGVFKHALPQHFPLQIGYDCAGIVEETGQNVTGLKTGDHVWSRLPEVAKGSLGQYVRCSRYYVSHKPTALSFADAASLPLAALTAMQALDRYSGSLIGKTVFVPAGLGGTGAFACQLAKNVHGAGKVITTVSTSKIDKVPEYLGSGVVDQIIDYTKDDPMKVIPHGSVDFILDTMGQAMIYLALMTPGSGMIVSISTTPSGAQLQDSSFFKRPDNPKMPFLARLYLDSVDFVRRTRAWRWGVSYMYMSLDANAKALDTLRLYVNEGKLRPVVGLRTSLNDIEAVRRACLQVYNGKGGIGKTVINIISE